MIKKIRKKIILYTILSVFAFLVVVLSTVNITNFALVTNDADNYTAEIQRAGGSLENNHQPDEHSPFDHGKKDNRDSIRYFTYSFYDDEPNEVAYRMDPTFKQTAKQIAVSLRKGKPRTGWTRTYYRYRTYNVIDNDGDKIRYVTVIDQNRELTPAYYVLFASLGGSLLGLGLVSIAIIFISKRLLRPIEETNNKQNRFIADAALALRTPTTVISIDNATLTQEGGEKPANKSIRKQVEKLTALADNLNSLAVFSTQEPNMSTFNFSNTVKEVLSQFAYAFKDNNKELIVEVQDNISYVGDGPMLRKMLSEIFDNALKFAKTTAKVALNKENERIILVVSNDSPGIPEGSLDTVFNKFSRLDYKDHSQYDGAGVGLSIVKEIVDKHHGRAIAKGESGTFVLKIEF